MDKKIVVIIIVATILILGSGLYLATRNASPTQAIKDINQLVGEARHATGSAQAKVTLVEFADFQCPACVVAYPYVKAILKSHKDNIYYVYRHFPLSQHKNAFIAAEASEAANEQGKFWEMYDLLYEKQKDWEESTNPIEKLSEYAKELGLDVDQFTKFLEKHKFKDIIQKDLDDALKLQVDATPTFYINGIRYLGDFRDMKAFIETKLQE